MIKPISPTLLLIIKNSTPNIPIILTTTSKPCFRPTLPSIPNSRHTSRFRMNGDLVLRHLVHTFHNINLSISGPFCANHPETGPDATGIRRHVCEVSNDEGTGIERFVCSETHGIASDAGSPVEATRGIDAHVDLVVLGAEKAGGEGLIFVQVADVFAIGDALW